MIKIISLFLSYILISSSLFNTNSFVIKNGMRRTNSNFGSVDIFDHRKCKTFSTFSTSSTSRISMNNLAVPGDVTIPQSKRKNTGTASLPTSSINLIKNCVGAGVFSLNSRVSSISSNPATLLPASALIILMALWATHNFNIVGKTCELTDSATYGEAWGKTISPNSIWIVQTVVTIAPIVSCLANTIVLSDILGFIIRSLGGPFWLYGNRNIVIALLGTFILFPLCTLEDLSALKSVSVVGLGGHLTAMAAFAIRLKDKSYLPGGAYYAGSVVEKASQLVTSPSTSLSIGNTLLKTDPSKWFVLASLLSYCFVSHYNAPKYYSELKDKEENPNKFLKLALISYLTIASVYIGTITLALRLFGNNSFSFALNNFSSKDPLGLISRMAFGTSVLASFPLIFLSIRNYFVNLWISKRNKINVSLISSEAASKNIKPVSMVLLSFICFLTSKFTDIGIVGSIAGGIFGSSMMFIFPPLMYINAIKMKAEKEGTINKLSTKRIIIINRILLLAGALLGICGTSNSILASLGKR